MNLEADQSGIRLLEKGAIRYALRWQDVERIHAFKRGVSSYDTICLEFKPVGKEEYWEIHMDMPGYEVVAKEMEKHLPGVDPEWWRKVAFPAAGADVTTIYTKHEGVA